MSRKIRFGEGQPVQGFPTYPNGSPIAIERKKARRYGGVVADGGSGNPVRMLQRKFMDAFDRLYNTLLNQFNGDKAIVKSEIIRRKDYLFKQAIPSKQVYGQSEYLVQMFLIAQAIEGHSIQRFPNALKVINDHLDDLFISLMKQKGMW